MQSKHLKWALILLALYVVYKRFLSKKEDFDLVPGIGPNGTITDVRNLVPGVFYKRGTLKPNTRNTITDAKNGGTTCTEFPSTIYIPITPVDAVCDFSGGKSYTQTAETLEGCPLINGVPTKTLTRIDDRTAFNTATTTTAAQYGGRDCFSQKPTTLPATNTFPCTSSLPSRCDPISNTSDYYDTSVADSFERCSVNVGGVWNKSIPKRTDTEINNRATIIAGINGGATCAVQNASIPATANVPCGTVNATCVGNDPTGIKSNVNSNYDTTLNLMNTPVIDTSVFWGTCKPQGYVLGSTENLSICCTKRSTGGINLNITGFSGFGGQTPTSSTLPNTCL